MATELEALGLNFAHVMTLCRTLKLRGVVNDQAEKMSRQPNIQTMAQVQLGFLARFTVRFKQKAEVNDLKILQFHQEKKKHLQSLGQGYHGC